MFGKTKFSYLILSLFFVGIFTISTPLHAALKDSDVDGLTDQGETEVYFTDPLVADTDGDGIDDGTEILNNTNPLVQEVLTGSIESSKIAWYIGRASGILAFVLLTLVVVNGLLMSTRSAYRFMPPALNYEMHRFFSWMAIVAIIGHFLSFTFDNFLHLTFLEGLIPFVLKRDFLSALGFNIGLAVTLGIIAFYGILTLVITSELKRFGFPLKKWRALHYISFLTYILFLAHGIMAGTDSGTWWMIWIYSLSGLLVFGLIVLRIHLSLKQKRNLANKKEAPGSV